MNWVPRIVYVPLTDNVDWSNRQWKTNVCNDCLCGIMDLGSVSFGMAKVHYTNVGIKENKTFSVNIPSVGMVEKADYCGLVSSKDEN